MKAYTAKGDKGETDLLFGCRVKKDDLRIECLGDLDELNSFLGLAKATIAQSAFKKVIPFLQNDIYFISSEIATQPKNLNKLQIRLSRERLLWLEKQINKLSCRVDSQSRCFFIPGENSSSAILDICRTICRRAERSAVALSRKEKIRNSLILAYLNRLSSLLFVLSRILEKKQKKFKA